MISIKADDHVWTFVGTREVYSSRRDAYVKAARLTRACRVCGAEFEVTQMLPTRSRQRAEELLANPPRGIPGVYQRTWTGRQPVKDVTLKVPIRGQLGLVTCPDHRGQSDRRRRPTLAEQIAALV
jgi:hypothetical protein